MPTHDMDLARRTATIEELREAVFTSMGIPPLFPYLRIDSGDGATWCEDGGVIDNLPIRLATAFQQVDLLFVLPLNATFAIDDLPWSLPSRLQRVVDVRQGILERLSLKATYLFNERLSLADPAYRPIPSFVIAPGQPLRIRTTELWRSAETRREVFEQMYLATRQLLEAFFQPAAIDAFFGAFDELKQTRSRVGPKGYVRMHVVRPEWRPGNPFVEESRF